MKVLLILIIGIPLSFVGCRNQQPPKTAAVSDAMVTTIALPTLKCNTCIATVDKALSSLDGIESADINLKEKKATVKFLPAKLTVDKIAEQISNAGYDANGVKRNSAAYENLQACCK